MTPDRERYARAQELFDAAVDLPSDQRAALLDARAREGAEAEVFFAQAWELGRGRLGDNDSRLAGLAREIEQARAAAAP